MPKLARLAVIAALILCVSLASFVAGYFVAGQSSLGASVPPVEPTPTSATATSQDLRQRLSLVEEAAKLVEAEFFDREALTRDEVVYGAIRGMVEQLGDPYTSFATPEQATMLSEDLNGKFHGIGAVVEVKDNKLLVVSPQDGSPAERAGLRPGDHISHVDGRPTDGLSVTEAVALIRGPNGSTVRLTIVRDGAEPREVEIVREEIKLEYVSWEMLPDGIAYVQLTSFGLITNDFVAALEEIKEQQATGLILDLRNNPGGYLDAAVDITSQFLAEGTVLYQENANGEREEYQVKPGALITDIPMVVLVNKGSASASEIVAGALQDHKRATIVGEKTFGKGSVQKIYRLSDNSSLRVTVARWFTPSGRAIHESGLEPDITVELPMPLNSREDDTQLQTAIELLSRNRSATAPHLLPAHVASLVLPS